MTAYYKPNDGFTANDALSKEQSWQATLLIAVSFQLIVYANIEITKRYYRTTLRVCCLAARKKEHKLGGQIFCKN